MYYNFTRKELRQKNGTDFKTKMSRRGNHA